MKNLNDLNNDLAKELYGISQDEAHKKNICLECKKEPRFYSEAGRKEYQISGICEYCFDALFKTND